MLKMFCISNAAPNVAVRFAIPKLEGALR